MNDKNTSHKTQTTIYDTTLKDIVKQQVRDILPVLLPGAIYEATINVELIRPKNGNATTTYCE